MLTNALEARKEGSGLVQISDEHVVANDNVRQTVGITVSKKLNAVTMILIVIDIHAVHDEIVLDNSVVLKYSETIADEVIDHVPLVGCVRAHAAEATPSKILWSVRNKFPRSTTKTGSRISIQIGLSTNIYKEVFLRVKS